MPYGTLEEERAAFRRSREAPCEVCEGAHATYMCCDQCNYVRHICHFCGDELGHTEVSNCYD